MRDSPSAPGSAVWLPVGVLAVHEHVFRGTSGYFMGSVALTHVAATLSWYGLETRALRGARVPLGLVDVTASAHRPLFTGARTTVFLGGGLAPSRGRRARRHAQGGAGGGAGLGRVGDEALPRGPGQTQPGTRDH
ncbi:hypothetical protein [Streptomyces puniciscabiei]|uniref:hypothetical protein n=1 Tax=Streptomyces puniciscabiei TaxID=164348 RepID=UPI00379419D1